MAAAAEILGADNVLGIYVENDLHPKREKFDAYVMAEMLGWKVKVVSVGLESDPRIAENTKDRCYYCKRAAFQTIREHAKEAGFGVLGLTYSPIRGPEGNIEYLGFLQKGAETTAAFDLDALVEESHQTLKEHGEGTV